MKGSKMNFFFNFPELFFLSHKETFQREPHQVGDCFPPSTSLPCLPSLPTLWKHILSWFLDKTKESRQLGHTGDFSCGLKNMGGESGKRFQFLALCSFARIAHVKTVTERQDKELCGFNF